MIVTELKRLLYVLLLVALQVLIMRHIHLWGYAPPLLTPLMLVFLPMNISRSETLLWAFFTGLLVDIFYNTPGVGSGAMTMAALIQPSLLNHMAPKDVPEDMEPTFRTMGTWNHFRYVMLIFIIHHAIYFMLESFSFFHFTELCISMLSSLMMSMLFAVSIEHLRNKKKKNSK